MIDPQGPITLMAIAVPIAVAWLGFGLVLAALYHLSLLVLYGEFSVPGEVTPDIAISILRGVIIVLLWPILLWDDRLALHRIKLMFLALDPKQRRTNEELIAHRDEGNKRAREHREAIEREKLAGRRELEKATGAERRRYSEDLKEGDPLLERTWFMMAVGSGPGGGPQLVRMYDEQDLPDEVAAKARTELALRFSQPCPGCGAAQVPDSVAMPQLKYMRVFDAKDDSLIVQGWALRGSGRAEFGACERCGHPVPPGTFDVTRFGNAAETLRQIRSGVSFHQDMP